MDQDMGYVCARAGACFPQRSERLSLHRDTRDCSTFAYWMPEDMDVASMQTTTCTLCGLQCGLRCVESLAPCQISPV
jgi:hypothetical protein